MLDENGVPAPPMAYPPGFEGTAAMYDDLRDRLDDLKRRLTHVKDSL